MFELEIETDGAAFDPLSAEVARILRDIASRVESESDVSGRIRDINGNTVGWWRVR